MCLSCREQRRLNLIRGSLSRSDPGLAAMLAIFSRLAAGEAMPGREQLRRSVHPLAALWRAAASAARRLIGWAAALVAASRRGAECIRRRSGPRARRETARPGTAEVIGHAAPAPPRREDGHQPE